MSVASRLLAQAQMTTSPVGIYSPPASTIGVMKYFSIANTSASDQTYRLFLDIDGTTYDEDSGLFWDVSIPQDTVDLVPVWAPMRSVSNFAIQAAANTAITITVGGYEVTEDEFFAERPLGQVRPSVVDTPVSIISPNVGLRVVIRGLIVANVDLVGADARYSIYLDHDGTTYNDSTAIARNILLARSTSDVLPMYLPMEDSAGNFAVETNDAANEVNFTAFGFFEVL